MIFSLVNWFKIKLTSQYEGSNSKDGEFAKRGKLIDLPDPQPEVRRNAESARDGPIEKRLSIFMVKPFCS
jgi:hypothetical protein